MQDPEGNPPSRFHARKSRKVRVGNGLLNTTVTVFHTFFTVHTATFGCAGFLLQGFPAHHGRVNREPLRTLSRGFYKLPHAAARRLLPFREPRPQTAPQILDSDWTSLLRYPTRTLDSDCFPLAFSDSHNCAQPFGFVV